PVLSVSILFPYTTLFRSRWFVIAGLFAGFSAACELPALSLTVLLGAILLWTAPRATLIGYLPAALVVAGAAFGTNYAALGTFDRSEEHTSELQSPDHLVC